MNGAESLELNDWDDDLGKGWAEQPLLLSTFSFLDIGVAAACWRETAKHCGLGAKSELAATLTKALSGLLGRGAAAAGGRAPAGQCCGGGDSRTGVGA